MKRYRVGAMAWVLSALVLPIQLFVALGWPNRYSLSRNTISDLGVTTCGEYSELGQQIRQVCSPEHAVFNIGMVASGALILLGAVVLHGYWTRLSGQAGTILMAIAGASVIGVGLLPWDVSPAAHDSFALLQAAAQWIAMALIAVAAGPGRFRKVTAAVVILSVASFIMFAAALDGYEMPWIGLGGAERLSFDSLTLWTALTGVALMRAHKLSAQVRERTSLRRPCDSTAVSMRGPSAENRT
ncbi:DUF998 domain-containing protein [Corynebacterium pilbarense]|uniref:DUF998 domain-containing protein n=1 Tax=Corynebacterium pilbarense TaxID=1288393 RepID=A0A9Q4IGJ8_9CORY|nr:DUF998 domain-containing protein [Corynebacterium pilbarense]MCZ2220639.1 DUF998 domain-containing protein [Corynebacterium pilbarense]